VRRIVNSEGRAQVACATGWNRKVPVISLLVDMEFERQAWYAMPISIHTGGHSILILPFSSSNQSINQSMELNKRLLSMRSQR